MIRYPLALTLVRNIPINLSRPSDPAGFDLYLVGGSEFRDACTDALFAWKEAQ